MCVFFFKQKTAYEMRISDWSSDVCSSDLGEYVPPTPNTYRNKAKNAQEAHEAIRPTDVTRLPKDVAAHLDNDGRRLYELIWKRAVASAMKSAEQIGSAARRERECPAE